ncbi:MAG: hypothetical protein ACI9YT_000706, partial [Halobacteriales archaeon]
KPTSNIFVWLLSQDSMYTVLPFEYVDRFGPNQSPTPVVCTRYCEAPGSTRNRLVVFLYVKLLSAVGSDSFRVLSIVRVKLVLASAVVWVSNTDPLIADAFGKSAGEASGEGWFSPVPGRPVHPAKTSRATTAIAESGDVRMGD